MSVFHFKRFDVINEKSAMKVNTDGVLLGAAMTILPQDRTFLDVGTGTGTIALMAAQRAVGTIDDSRKTEDRMIHVDAIDMDEASAVEAALNFCNSPWPDCLEAHHCPLDAFASAGAERKYDLIFSNPPYFDDSLHAPMQRRSDARHTSTGLSYRELLEYASSHLTETGRIAMILPAVTEMQLCRHARMNGLHLNRIIRVRTVPRKSPVRIIAEFSRNRTENPQDSTLTIQDEGKYTQEYLSLTRDFYLFS